MPTPQQRRMLFGNSQRYADYIASVINPILWLRLRETTGAVAANSGSGSAALNGAITACTLAQTGGGNQGANEAMLWDGATSLITVPNNALLSGLTTQKWAYLCKPASLGEGSSGALFKWGNSASARFFLASSNRLAATIDMSGTDTNVTSNNSQVDFLTKWAWVFMDYDDADALGLGRRMRLFRGLNGAVAQLTLATDTAGTGTVTVQAVDLIIGNRVAADNTFDGPIDEVIFTSGLWTTAQMQAITSLTGV